MKFFAVDRLKLLKCVELAKARFPKRDDQFETIVSTALKTFNESATLHIYDDLEAKVIRFHERRKDHISHYILRLAYCKSEDLRRWFLTQELELFRFRFLAATNANKDNVNTFLKDNGLKYNPISMEIKEAHKLQLAASSNGKKVAEILNMEFFKVTFEEAIDLVKTRRVYLKKGFAFVPGHDLISLVLGEFRKRLSIALTLTSKALPSLEEDDRILPMLENLSKQYLGRDYSNVRSDHGVVTLEQIPSLTEESFPLCMRQTQGALAKDHHLKHGGRMQYGLFLKGIGMTLDEALRFWRTSFLGAPGMSVDKFDKQYAYNIRHNYGKEGKRTDYTPYSCLKIITGTGPSAGDAHGCPFRHSDKNDLYARMLAYGIPEKSAKEIKLKVEDQHYQIACHMYFRITHNTEQADWVLEHPNQYFDESRKMRTGNSTSATIESSSTSAGSAATAAVLPKPETKSAEDDDDELMRAMETE